MSAYTFAISRRSLLRRPYRLWALEAVIILGVFLLSQSFLAEPGYSSSPLLQGLIFTLTLLVGITCSGLYSTSVVTGSARQILYRLSLSVVVAQALLTLFTVGFSGLSFDLNHSLLASGLCFFVLGTLRPSLIRRENYTTRDV